MSTRLRTVIRIQDGTLQYYPPPPARINMFEVFKSVVIEANPKISKAEVERLAKKYTELTKRLGVV